MYAIEEDEEEDYEGEYAEAEVSFDQMRWMNTVENSQTSCKLSYIKSMI